MFLQLNLYKTHMRRNTAFFLWRQYWGNSAKKLKHTLSQSVQIIKQDPKSLSLKLKQIGNTAWLTTAASKSLFPSSASFCVVPGYTENTSKIKLASLRVQEENMKLETKSKVSGLNKNIAFFLSKTEFLRKSTWAWNRGTRRQQCLICISAQFTWAGSNTLLADQTVNTFSAHLNPVCKT